MAQDEVKVIVIHSGAFVGATWVSSVLDSRAEVFSVGNIMRSERAIAEKGKKVCLIHREQCSFWPRFLDTYDENDHLLVQVAQHTGCEFVVTNNPDRRQIAALAADDRIVMRHLHIIRDARQLAASYWRKHPELRLIDVVRDWLVSAVKRAQIDDIGEDAVVLRHEQILVDNDLLLRQLSDFTGLDYDESHLKFWEFDHHFLVGNGGTIGTIRMAQGEKVHFAEHNKFYTGFVEQTKTEPAPKFTDERWKSELSSFDRYCIDSCAGALNARRGYDRDVFSDEQVTQFQVQLAELDATASAAQRASKPVAAGE